MDDLFPSRPNRVRGGQKLYYFGTRRTATIFALSLLLTLMLFAIAQGQNQPPNVSNCPGSLTTSHCAVLTYDFEATDPEGDPITGWIVDIGTISIPDGMWYYFPYDVQEGTLTLHVQACDEFGCGPICEVPIVVTNEGPSPVENPLQTECGDTIWMAAGDSVSNWFPIRDDCDPLTFTLQSMEPTPDGYHYLQDGRFHFYTTDIDGGNVFEVVVEASDGLETAVCTLYYAVFSGNNNPPMLDGDCGKAYLAPVNQQIQARFSFFDWDESNWHEWSVKSDASVTGSYWMSYGDLLYEASSNDLSVPQPIEFSIMVTDGGGAADTCSFYAEVVSSGNNPPIFDRNIVERGIPVYVEATVDLKLRDPDVGDSHTILVNGPSNIMSSYWASGDTLHYVPEPTDAYEPQPLEFEVIATDYAGAADTALVRFYVYEGAPIKVALEDVHNAACGHLQYIGISLTNIAPATIKAIHEMDLYIAYDTSYLDFQYAEAGQAMLDLAWEYFNVEEVQDCTMECPPGLLHIKIIPEIDNGPVHPIDLVPETPAELCQLVFNLDTVCSDGEPFPLIPIQFHWMSCAANEVEVSFPGDTASQTHLLISSKVFGYVLYEGYGEYIEITEPNSWSYYGAANLCWGAEPERIPYIDYYSVLPDDWINRPRAIIEEMTPNPATIGENVFFDGTGYPGQDDDPVANYEWTSSVDGLLSTSEDFSTDQLTPGPHLIRFRVQNSGGYWSDYYQLYLRVGEVCDTIEVKHCDSVSIDLTATCGMYPWKLVTVDSGPGTVDTMTQVWSSAFDITGANQIHQVVLKACDWEDPINPLTCNYSYLYVEVTNEPPVLSAGCGSTYAAPAGVEISIPLAAADTSCPSDPVMLLALVNPTIVGPYYVDSVSGTLHFTPDPLDAGLQTITVAATDGLDTSYCDLYVNVTIGSNGSPRLDWAGTAGYESDAVEPDTGISYQDFLFKVKYSDPDGDPPAEGYPVLEIDYDGDMPESGAIEVSYQMYMEEPGDYTTGVVYSCVVPYLPVSNSVQYRCSAYDSNGALADDDAAITQSFTTGPLVLEDAVDLYVYSSMIDFSDLTPEVSQEFQSTTSIFNSSSQTLTDVLVYYYMQVDFVNVLVDSTVVASLPPGSLTLPAQMWQVDEPGFYPITVLIDPKNEIEEWNEDNNSAVRPVTVGEFTVPGAMDIINLALTSTICPGRSMNLKGQGWYLQPPSTYLSTAAGAEVTVTNLSTLESWVGYTDASGTFGIGFTAPEIQSSYELEVYMTDFTVQVWDTVQFSVVDCSQPDCADLSATLSLSNLPIIVESNPTTTYSARVYNNGNLTTSPVTARLLSDGGVIASYAVGALAPGSYYDLPSGQITYATTGTHNVRVLVDPDNVQSECNEQNNVTSRSHYVWPNCADLGAEVLTASNSNPYVDQQVQISVRIGNNGGLSAGGSWVRFLVDGAEVDSSRVTGVDGFGQETWASFTHAFSSLGQHQVQAILDAQGELTECSEWNNEIQMTITVIDRYPDLWSSYQDIKLTSTASESSIGTPVQFESRIYNSGTADAHNVVVRYLIDAIELSVDTVELIAAGTSVVDTASNSWTAESGHCNINVVIDPADEIHETNDDNNSASCPILHDLSCYYPARCSNSHPGPKFINSCDNGRPEALIGTEVTLVASIQNAGAFVVDGPVTVTIDDVSEGHIGDILLYGINDHKSDYVTGQLSHTFTTSGWHRLTSHVDSPSDYFECVESNNIYTDSIFIYTLQPDLWLLSEHIDMSSISPDIDEPVYIDATIWNSGEIEADSVSVVFQVDAEQLGDTVWIPSIPIEVNDNYRTVSATDPWIATDLPQNQHVIRVIADAASSIEEMDENNNEATRDILVGNVPDLTIDENSFSFNNVDGELCDVVALTFDVRNLGGQEATCTVELSYLDPGEGYVLAGQTTNVVVPGHGGSTPATIQWNVPGYIPDLQLDITDVTPDDFIMENNTVEVAYDRTGLRPCLGVHPTDISFGAGKDRELPDTKTLVIDNMGDGLLEWYIDEQIDWLSITPFEGSSSSANIQVSIGTTNLQESTYQGSMVVTSTNADNGPKLVNVGYVVQIRPVIFLPGMMGTHIYQISGLRGDTDCSNPYECECWFSLVDAIGPYELEEYILKLRFNDDGQGPVYEEFNIDSPGLVLGEGEHDAFLCEEFPNWEGCPLLDYDKDFYGGIIEAIDDMPQYVRNDNFFVFPYDFRYDNIETADSLETFVERNIPDGQPFDVVVHSMGGIVARLYANRHPGRVDRAVFIGTPHHGSLKMLTVLLEQESAVSPILSKRASKELARNFISAYELLPDFTDGVFYTEYEYVLDNKQKHKISTVYSEYNDIEALLDIAEIDRLSFSQHISDFHSELTQGLGTIRQPNIIAGYGYDTGRRLEKYSMQYLSGTILPSNYYIETYNGDETVTLLSATSGLTGIDDNHIYYCKEKHTRLPNNPSVIEMVQAILGNTDRSGINGISYHQPPSKRKRKIFTFSPVSIVVSDTAGNQCYYDDSLDAAIANIPYSYFNRFDENELFSGPDSLDYTVALTGLDSGSFSLFIEQGTDDTVFLSQVLYNVVVEPDSRGVLTVSGTGDSLTAQFVYDYDGDGTFSDTIAPTVLQSVGTIEGRVYGDSILMSGIDVNLLDSLGQLLQSVSTDDSGYYCFADLPVAQYTVTISPPSGYYASESDKQIIILGLTQQLNFDMVSSCCGIFASGFTGNADCGVDGKINLADVTKLIDRVYLSKLALCCEENGNVDGDIEYKLNLADITKLIDHIYLSKQPTAACP